MPRLTLLRASLLVLIVFSACAAAGMLLSRPRVPIAVAPRPIGHAPRGALLYTLHCAKCHGDEGRGDAEGAEKLIPPPRDFSSRPWRHEPSAASIERIVARGIPGTSMPAFGATLLDADIAALTDHVLTLSTGASAAPSQPDDPFRAAGFAALAAPRAAPALALTSAAGEQLSLSQLRGKVVLLNFWGVSCEHCLAKMPRLARFQQQLGEPDFVVVNICADEDDAATAQEMLTAAAPELTAYVDPTGLANARYQVSLLPTLWLIDRQGRLIAQAQGARDWTDPKLRMLIDRLK